NASFDGNRSVPEIRSDKIGIPGSQALRIARDCDLENPAFDDAALLMRMAMLQADGSRLECEAHEHDPVIVAKHLAANAGRGIAPCDCCVRGERIATTVHPTTPR